MKKLSLIIALGSLVFAACTGGKGTATANTDTTTVKHPEWSRNAVIYEVNTRQYTPEGTFQAFLGQIPRLNELGVDILWFMPIHPISQLNRKGELGSYYAVADYKAVNPEFGTLDDFKAVVDSAHAVGMKVILDWVPNHTGCDNPWVAEHPDRFARNEQGEMFGPFDWSDVYQLDYSNPDTREAMIDAMKFWLTEANVDGFRCDYAEGVPVDFWNEARTQLEAAKPDIFMLAEAAAPELEEHAFDMLYNWPMSVVFNSIATNAGQYKFIPAGETEVRHFDPANATAIEALLKEQAAKYPVDSYMMVMTSNHDYNSWEGTEFERLGNLSDAFAILSYTLPGMPLIYTGQETGMDHAFEFFVKDNAPEWEPRNEFFTFYQTLNGLKHSRPELAAGSRGGEMVFYPTASDDIIVFSRTVDGSTTVVGANLGAETSDLVFTDAKPEVAGMRSVMDAASVEQLPATLKPGEYFLYIN